MAKKESYDDAKSKLIKEQDEILSALVDMYVANKGTKQEFISCITPEKRTSHTWLLWTQAMRILKKTKDSKLID